MIKKYYDCDCDLKLFDGKTVAVIGFGSQGHAHAMNLADSGVNVVVGLRAGSRHAQKAKDAGLKVMSVSEAAKAGDFVMMLVPDETCADIYEAEVKPYMTAGKVLMFAHGLNIHFQLIKPSSDIDVIMVAPKGPGHTVRSQYVEGKGVPSLIAVYQDASGNWKEVENPSAYGVERGSANIVNFTPVSTKALRLQIQLEENFAAGISEWAIK